jgi:hypothetical protein
MFNCPGYYIISVLNIAFFRGKYSSGLTHAIVGKYRRNSNEIGQAEEIEIERAYLHPDWDYDSGKFTI